MKAQRFSTRKRAYQVQLGKKKAGREKPRITGGKRVLVRNTCPP